MTIDAFTGNSTRSNPAYWLTAANWSNGVPTATSDVVVNNGFVNDFQTPATPYNITLNSLALTDGSVRFGYAAAVNIGTITMNSVSGATNDLAFYTSGGVKIGTLNATGVSNQVTLTGNVTANSITADYGTFLTLRLSNSSLTGNIGTAASTGVPSGTSSSPYNITLFMTGNNTINGNIYDNVQTLLYANGSLHINSVNYLKQNFAVALIGYNSQIDIGGVSGTGKTIVTPYIPSSRDGVDPSQNNETVEVIYTDANGAVTYDHKFIVELNPNLNYRIQTGTNAAGEAVIYFADALAPTIGNASVVNGVVDAVHDTAAQAISGSAPPGSTVTLTQTNDPNAPVLTAVADANGKWSITVGHLADGVYSYTASVEDPNAAPSTGTTTVNSAPLTFTVNTTPVVTITSVSTSENFLNSAMPITVTGTGQAGTIVTVMDGAVALGTAIVGASGAWSWSGKSNFAVGSTHNLTAVDAAPNGAKATSAAATVIVASAQNAVNASTVTTNAEIFASLDNKSITGGSGNNTVTLLGSNAFALLDNLYSFFFGQGLPVLWAYGQATIDGGKGGTNTLDLSHLGLVDATINLATGKISSWCASANISDFANLIGGVGNETIIGDSGKNVITAGVGVDTITGGGGSDTFVFNANSLYGAHAPGGCFYSGLANAASRDTITDFTQGTDKIDLSGFANGTGQSGLHLMLGNQYSANTLDIGSLPANEFSATDHGMVDWHYELFNGVQQTIVDIHLNASGKSTVADYQIALNGHLNLKTNDFVF